MAPASATVEILVTRGGLEPQAALAVAEAIENEMTNSKLVTVPVLDARVASLETTIERTKSELVRWVFGTFLGSSVISGAGAVVTYFLGRAAH